MYSPPKTRISTLRCPIEPPCIEISHLHFAKGTDSRTFLLNRLQSKFDSITVLTDGCGVSSYANSFHLWLRKQTSDEKKKLSNKEDMATRQIRYRVPFLLLVQLEKQRLYVSHVCPRRRSIKACDPDLAYDTGRKNFQNTGFTHYMEAD